MPMAQWILKAMRSLSRTFMSTWAPTRRVALVLSESVTYVTQPVYTNCIHYCNYVVSTLHKKENKFSMKTKLYATERLRTEVLSKNSCCLRWRQDKNLGFCICKSLNSFLKTLKLECVLNALWMWFIKERGNSSYSQRKTLGSLSKYCLTNIYF